MSQPPLVPYLWPILAALTSSGPLTLGPLLDQLFDRRGEGGFEVDDAPTGGLGQGLYRRGCVMRGVVRCGSSKARASAAPNECSLRVPNSAICPGRMVDPSASNRAQHC
jgi:hypothetical protein